MDRYLFHVLREQFVEQAESEAPGARARLGVRSWEQNIAARHLSPPGRLLLIGSGREGIALRDMGHEVIRIDPSAQPVGPAEHAIVEPANGIAVQRYDGRRLDVPDEWCDYVVIGSEALANVPHYHQRLRLLRECARVLRPAGRLLLSARGWETRERGRLHAGEDAASAAGLNSQALCFLHACRPEEILELCGAADYRAPKRMPEQADLGMIRVCVCEKV